MSPSPSPIHSLRRFLLPLLGLVVLAAVLALGAANGPPGMDLRPGLDPDSVFTAEVVPLLRTECGACHFAGGEMYASMPFDELAVLLSLEGEVLTRMEGEARPRLAAWYAWMREEGDAGRRNR